MEIHFTVRISMAEGESKCRVLKNWKTDHSHAETVVWQLQDRKLSEHGLTPKSDISAGEDKDEDVEDKDHYLFSLWCSGAPAKLHTERKRFASRAKPVGSLVHEAKASNKQLVSFISILGPQLTFEGKRLAPNAKYPSKLQ
jgi:hypothetical protein